MYTHTDMFARTDFNMPTALSILAGDNHLNLVLLQAHEIMKDPETHPQAWKHPHHVDDPLEWKESQYNTNLNTQLVSLPILF